MTTASRTLASVRFMLGSVMDVNSSGWVVGDLAAAITFAIEDKARHINGRYARNWLVLVDRGDLFHRMTDIEQAWPLVGRTNCFERVLVLHGWRDDLFFDSFGQRNARTA